MHRARDSSINYFPADSNTLRYYLQMVIKLNWRFFVSVEDWESKSERKHGPISASESIGARRKALRGRIQLRLAKHSGESAGWPNKCVSIWPIPIAERALKFTKSVGSEASSIAIGIATGSVGKDNDANASGQSSSRCVGVLAPYLIRWIQGSQILFFVQLALRQITNGQLMCRSDGRLSTSEPTRPTDIFDQPMFHCFHEFYIADCSLPAIFRIKIQRQNCPSDHFANILFFTILDKVTQYWDAL